jgi:flagellar basal-body rod protein FlgF
MSNSISVALSSQQALRRQMDVVANNVANASTPAFKGQRMMFAEWLSRTGGTDKVSFVQDYGTRQDLRQGTLTQTGNTLDLALKGDGFLAVQTAEGVRYTRNGRLQLDEQRQLVTGAGEPVLAEGDQPLNIPPEAIDISIARDGTVSTEQGIAGRINVVRFAQDARLLPAAGGLYITDANPQPADGTLVVQGMVEESNVQSIIEITRMMELSNRYNAAKDMLDGEDDRLKNAIDKLSRVA